MSHSHAWLVAATFLVIGFPLAARADGEPKLEDDEQQLRRADMPVDGPALLDFLRKRTVTEADRDAIQKMVRQLGDDAFAVRRKAMTDLVEVGSRATALLRQATNDPDLEIRRNAADCLRQIKDKDQAVRVIPAAARLIAARKPAGSAEVLLNYLRFADDDLIDEEVRRALAAMALRDGKADPVLVTGLTDKDPVRRAAAAEALCRAKLSDQLPAVRKLLADPETPVRIRVGLALARAQEKEAVPVLIDLLAQLPQTQAWPIEDLLFRLADGKSPPNVSLGADEAARRKCRAAWSDWWQKHAGEVDLARLESAPPLLGYTMVVLLEAGRLTELGTDNKPRWQIDGLEWPLDAQILSGDRVLVAENNGNRVTERNFKGEVLWEKKIDSPIMAQRLRNGHTFIATMNQMIEVDRAGNPVATSVAPGGEAVHKACKLPDGRIACVTSGGKFVLLDPTGKELHTFPAEMRHFGGRIEVLPNGRVLFPLFHAGKVVEYDPDGKIVWEINAPQAINAVRLPNGNTLVTFMNEPRAVELDRAGKEVWEYKADSRLTRAWRR
jgi:HEAT repeats/PQQ-like domain